MEVPDRVWTGGGGQRQHGAHDHAVALAGEDRL